jgi:2-polyprenyl-3-methyl-5-hydroxy-6-metoxy-1,4-benzoquinol methylase
MTNASDIETRKQQLRAEELLQLIRKEARFLEQEEQVQMGAISVPLNLRELPEWEARGTELPVKQSYHVNELTIYDDIEFVIKAYRAILQRDPDESGLDAYVIALREHGPQEKMSIVLNLLDSEEGRASQVHIQGIRWEKFEHRHGEKWWFNLRLIRNLFKLGKQLQRNNLQEYALFNEKSRIRFEGNVDDYLCEQQQLFNFLREREKQLEVEQESIHLKMDRYRRDMQLTRQDLLIQQQKLNLLLSELRGELESGSLSVEQKQNLAMHASEKLDAFYLAFENECRGDEAEIREQLAEYLPRIKDSQKVSAEHPLLDIGSGRGEWLALLRDNEISAEGVDVSKVLVEHCRQQQLQVTLADALAFLADAEDSSYGAVTAFHIIEHLPFEQLYTLVEQCHRVLVPGGQLIFETPNPENMMVGSHTFYHDPTHLNPITPTLIEFLVRHLGFSDPEILRLHPYPPEARVRGMDPLTDRINGAFCGPQDFAVCAVKPA